MSVQELTIRKPDDWHLHLRDGEALQAVVADTARQFARAIIMPNLKPPVTTTERAIAYKKEILDALAKTQYRDSGFDPLMVLYLTDNMSPEEIRKAKDSGAVTAVKLYPAGATTNSDAGVTNLLKHCTGVLEMMQKLDIPLLTHGEVTDSDIDIFDREAVFIDRTMIPLRKAFPELRVVFEHITTKNGAHYVRDAEGPIAATITPQHLLFNRNAIFNMGLRPHYYCLPVLKREEHRQALVEAATSGHPRFFLGTDSAPHPQSLKEHASACAGCYSAYHALELYMQVFDDMGCLDNFEAFASLNGPAFYKLPVNTETVTLRRESFEIPASLPFTPTNNIVPLAAGDTLNWRLV